MAGGVGGASFSVDESVDSDRPCTRVLVLPLQRE